MKRKQRGLGRGISALLPGSELVEDFTMLDIDLIESNPYQPRKRFSEAELKELARSIEKNGVLQPIIVRQRQDGKYEIVAGERRWRAARIAGLKKIPAIIKDLEDSEVLQIALIENLQRQDLDPIEEALAYKDLMDRFGFTQNEIAELVGKDRATVTNRLRLLNLSEGVIKALRDGLITEGHARVLLRIEDPQEQERICRMVIENGLSVRQLEKMIAPKERKKTSDEEWVSEVSRRIFEKAGLKGQIKATSRKVKVILDFKNREELEEFLRRIGV